MKMMKDKNLTMTTGLILLLVIGIGIFYFQSRPSEKNDSQIDKENINKIIIENSQEKIVLKKESGWIIENNNNIPANSSKVDLLLDSLKEINRSELVSKNPNNFPEYGINDQSPKITFYQNEKELQVIVGDISFNRAGNFVKYKNGQVHLISSYLKNRIEDTVWENFNVFSFVPGSVQSLSIGYNNKKAEFTKKDDQWQADIKVNLENIDKFLSKLASLTAINIFTFEEKGKEFEAQDKVVVTLKIEDKEIVFYCAKDSQLLKREDSDFIYEINSSDKTEIYGLVKNITPPYFL
jgi:hypothetical protein